LDGEKTYLQFDSHNFESLYNSVGHSINGINLYPEKLNIFSADFSRQMDQAAANREAVTAISKYAGVTLNQVAEVARLGYEEFKGLEILGKYAKIYSVINADLEFDADKEWVISHGGTPQEAAFIGAADFALDSTGTYLGSGVGAAMAASTLTALSLPVTGAALLIGAIGGIVYMSVIHDSSENGIRADLSNIYRNMGAFINGAKEETFGTDVGNQEGNDDTYNNPGGGGSDSSNNIIDKELIWNQLDRSYTNQQFQLALANPDTVDYLNQLASNPIEQFLAKIPDGGIGKIGDEYYMRQGDVLVKMDLQGLENLDPDAVYDPSTPPISGESGDDSLGGGAGADTLSAHTVDIAALLQQ
jgi:hypothetical protein